jgi:prefoldin alpha subunit
MAKEEYILRLSLLEQEANKMQEQLQAVDQQITEFELLKLSLDNLEKAKEKTFLASLGKGIFVNSELKDKELFVNVGSGVVIKKKPKEAIVLINTQIRQLEEIKGTLMHEIENINSQLQKLVGEARSSS